MRIGVQRQIIVMHREIRPQRFRKHEFRIRVLIQQEVAQPLLPARADQQIHIRLPAGIQMLRNRRLRDLLRAQRAVAHQRGNLLRRLHQLRPSAVVHGDVQPQPGVPLRPRFGRLQGFPLRLRQASLVPQNQDPDVLRVQLVDLGVKKVQNQLHQRGDLLRAPVPVLGGKGIKAQRPDAQVIRMPDDLPQGFRPLPVPPGNAQAVLPGPPAVPVHDDGHMLRQPGKFIRAPRRLLQRPDQIPIPLDSHISLHDRQNPPPGGFCVSSPSSPDQTSMISFSFFA